MPPLILLTINEHDRVLIKFPFKGRPLLPQFKANVNSHLNKRLP